MCAVRLVDEALELVLGRDVGGDGDRGFAPGGGVDRVRRLNAGLGLARRDHDLRAMLGEALRDRPADAPRRAGDDGDAAAEIEQIGQGFLP